MSKELEALKRIKENTISPSRSNWETEYYYVGNIESIKKDFDIVEKALKRNEPMKVIFTRIGNDITGTSWDEPTCPKCKSLVSDAEKFCSECEQKLDWGKYK